MLQRRFLVFSEKDRSAQLLGYPLKLSPAEYDLLYLIAEATYIEKAELARLVENAIAPGSIAVHVHGINKKAKKISGRQLVVYVQNGYTLYQQM